jgi:hypothetical protein
MLHRAKKLCVGGGEVRALLTLGTSLSLFKKILPFPGLFREKWRWSEPKSAERWQIEQVRFSEIGGHWMSARRFRFSRRDSLPGMYDDVEISTSQSGRDCPSPATVGTSEKIFLKFSYCLNNHTTLSCQTEWTFFLCCLIQPLGYIFFMSIWSIL